RLMLNGFIDNLQVSWVKEGPRFAQACLMAGANDLGGTLMNESISTAAGASYGQLVRPMELRALIRSAGRVPAERSTTYQTFKEFFEEPEAPHPLDSIEEPEERFGSFQRLIHMSDLRFQPGIASGRKPPDGAKDR
ncbi:MAG TPA: hypothetical protein VGK54_07915, partial [Chloroflexota bacterium]